MKKLCFILLLLPNFAFAQDHVKDTLLSESFNITEDTTNIDSFTTANLTLIDSLINYSHQYLGVPYKYAGRDSGGFDCSGFVCHVYHNFGYNLPPSSSGQATQGKPVKRDNIQPGDIVYFKGRNVKSKRVGHVGIVVKNEDGVITFIHASSSLGISITDTNSAYYKARYLGARRIITE